MEINEGEQLDWVVCSSEKRGGNVFFFFFFVSIILIYVITSRASVRKEYCMILYLLYNIDNLVIK